MPLKYQHYKEVPVLLTPQEAHKRRSLSLDTNEAENTFSSVDEYINVHFGQLREFFVHDFRESISEYQSKKEISGCVVPLKYGNIHVGVKISERQLKFLGYTYSLELNIDSDINWALTKRLTPGTFLCLTQDNFESFLFAVVSSRRPLSGFAQVCKIEVVIEPSDILTVFDTSKNCDVIETYYRYYDGITHALKRLKELDSESFPLSDCLVKLQHCNQKPPYLLEKYRDHSGDTFFQHNSKEGESSQVTGHHIAASMESIPEELDMKQREAFRFALTNQLALIGGVAGSGKTFLCSQIFSWLLKNAKASFKCPVLFLCNTDSCLDNQLEKFLSLTDCKAIRVGGGCKSDSVKNCELSHLRKRMTKIMKNCEIRSVEETISKMDLEVGKHPKNSSKITQGMKWFSSQCLSTLSTSYKKSEDKSSSKCAKSSKKTLPPNAKNSKRTSSVNDTTVLEVFYDEDLEKNDIKNDVFINQHENLQHTFDTMKVSPLRDNDILKLIVPMDCWYDLCTHSGNLKKRIVQWLRISPSSVDFLRDSKTFKTTLLQLLQEQYVISNKVDKDEILKTYFSPDAQTFPIIEKAVQRCLTKSEESTLSQTNLKQMSLLQRYAIFCKWKRTAVSKFQEDLSSSKVELESYVSQIKTAIFKESIESSVDADVIGMTFLTALKHPKFLKSIRSRVIVVDESNELMESLLVASLPSKTEHLILFGDIQRNSKVTSLFHRLIANGTPSCILQNQYRMRQEIIQMLVPEYYPEIEACTISQSGVRGVSKSVFFANHKKSVDSSKDEFRAGCCDDECKFILSLHCYLTQRGYNIFEVVALVSNSEQLQMMKEMAEKYKVQVNVYKIEDFVGREADIILLWLGNDLKDLDNGVGNVYLSLTRTRTGFYCIANFDELSGSNYQWSLLLSKLKSEDLIGKDLALTCMEHPQNITMVSHAKDFKCLIKPVCHCKQKN